MSRRRMLLAIATVAFASGACSSGSPTPSPLAPTERPTTIIASPVVATTAPAEPSAAGSASAPVTLRALAGSRYFGSAVALPQLDSDAAYAKIAGEQFSQVTPENAMKWGPVEPVKGQFDWTAADEIVAFAQAHNQVIRGHTLVWYNQLPGWLNVDSIKAAELSSLLQSHIAAVVGRYKGKIAAWDVVNEPFNDDGSWRDTVFYRLLGKGYVADAFKWAHAADPAAKLYLNDYNVEGVNPKSDALYELAKSLKAAGVPIDGVGFQGHFDIAYPFPNDMAANMQRLADLGLDVAVTELDVRMAVPAAAAALATQADYYKQTVAACLAVKRCVGITVWGFGDKYSWVPYTFSSEGAADLYDENLAPKPGLAAVQDALAGK